MQVKLNRHREVKLMEKRNRNMKCTTKVSFRNWEIPLLLFKKNIITKGEMTDYIRSLSINTL